MNRYTEVINILCEYYNVDSENVYSILKKKDTRYLLLLLLKELKGLDRYKVKEELEIKSDITILNNLKRAEEKLLINRMFREEYFELEDKYNRKYKNV